MSSRISFNQISARILDRLFTNYNKLESIQQQLATGKRVERSSDNPVAASQSMELRSELDQFASFQRNLDDGLGYLGTIDSTLNSANSVYQVMREKAVQANNGTNSAESRYYIGREARGMFDQMVAISNTTFKGEFVFSGTNSDLPPYEMRKGASTIIAGAAAASSSSSYAAIGSWITLKDTNVNDSVDNVTNVANAELIIPGTFSISGMKEGTDFEVDYRNGKLKILSAPAAALIVGGGATANYDWLRRNEKDLDGVANREIEEGVKTRINTTATDVFGGKVGVNAWEGMIDLLDGALNNKQEKLIACIDKLDASFTRQLTAQATNGARVLRLEATQTRNVDRQVYTTELQSNIEDVDFAKAISDFNLQQAIYDASLKMGAKSLQNSLMDFL